MAGQANLHPGDYGTDRCHSDQHEDAPDQVTYITAEDRNAKPLHCPVVLPGTQLDKFGRGGLRRRRVSLVSVYGGRQVVGCERRQKADITEAQVKATSATKETHGLGKFDTRI